MKSRKAGLRTMEGVTSFIEKKLSLKVNREKSAVDRPWNRKFLGFSFTNRKEPKIRISKNTEIKSVSSRLVWVLRIGRYSEYL
ncbi:hypothetical protein [Neobacillus drentensis]|uniref:hypothetical protein n=1 Tax=Neobacillus drentensis TaxID=220684 RepID=UPI003B5861C4